MLERERYCYLNTATTTTSIHNTLHTNPCPGTTPCIQHRSKAPGQKTFQPSLFACPTVNLNTQNRSYSCRATEMLHVVSITTRSKNKVIPQKDVAAAVKITNCQLYGEQPLHTQEILKKVPQTRRKVGHCSLSQPPPCNCVRVSNPYSTQDHFCPTCSAAAAAGSACCCC